MEPSFMYKLEFLCRKLLGREKEQKQKKKITEKLEGLSFFFFFFFSALSGDGWCWGWMVKRTKKKSENIAHIK